MFPVHDPIGFALADWIELALALFLILLWLCRSWFHAFAARFAHRTVPCMLLLAILPIALRLALLPQSSVPTPDGADDFSYLLLGDTLTHFRLANPPHPLSPFFEAVFVLQQPTYSSIFPLGQGMVLAFGSLLFREPWAGVALSVAALCACAYWMLRAWVPPAWALLGGIFALIEFGPLSQWMNTYWGGAVSAIAGCLVFGALPRFQARPRLRYGLVLGCSLGLQLLTRPFEFLLLCLSALLFLLFPIQKAKRTALALAVAALPLFAAAGLTLLQNKAVTGDWATLPYMLSRYQYGVPATFTFQPNPVPHRPLTPEQELDYRAQCLIHGDKTDTLQTYLQRLLYRIRYYRFFFLPPLYIALVAFCFTLRQRRNLWVVITILLFACGTNFYPYFYPHYIAALTCLFLYISVAGLQKLSQWSPYLSDLISTLCVAIFLFWYTLHLIGPSTFSGALDYEPWNYINWGDPEGRIAIQHQLEREPGKQLVFVHYSPQHRFREWIHNAADIDASRIVWAHDLGPTENQKLIRYYQNRHVWLVKPDADPPQLTPYAPAPESNQKTFESVNP